MLNAGSEAVSIGLMRHGIAEDSRTGNSDIDRRLTVEGRTMLQRQARWMAGLKLPFELVVSSPLRRARETAEIIANGLGIQSVTDELLRPGCAAADLAELVSHHFSGTNVLFVGHQPDLSMIVGALTGRRVNFGQGDLVVLETRDPGSLSFRFHAAAREQQ
jgi:phosphohistidine phosphatase